MANEGRTKDGQRTTPLYSFEIYSKDNIIVAVEYLLLPGTVGLYFRLYISYADSFSLKLVSVNNLFKLPVLIYHVCSKQNELCSLIDAIINSPGE